MPDAQRCGAGAVSHPAGTCWRVTALCCKSVKNAASCSTSRSSTTIPRSKTHPVNRRLAAQCRQTKPQDPAAPEQTHSHTARARSDDQPQQSGGCAGSTKPQARGSALQRSAQRTHQARTAAAHGAQRERAKTTRTSVMSCGYSAPFSLPTRCSFCTQSSVAMHRWKVSTSGGPRCA